MNTFQKLVFKFRSLLSDKFGNGEIVAVLVAVGIAVTLGFGAVKLLGTASKGTATKQGTAIGALPSSGEGS